MISKNYCIVYLYTKNEQVSYIVFAVLIKFYDESSLAILMYHEYPRKSKKN